MTNANPPWNSPSSRLTWLVAFSVLLGVVFCRPWPGAAAGPQQTIKVEATSVSVDVIVTDHKGAHVPGLTRDDFEVFDNDVPQRIVTLVPPAGTTPTGPTGPAALTTSSAGGSVPAAGSSTAGRASPPSAVPDLAEIHFVTLVVDLADTLPSDLPAVRRAATKYVQRVLAPDDFVAVYYVDHSLHLALPFTRDRPAAVETLARVTRRTTSGALSAQEREETQTEINDMLLGAVGIKQAGGMPDISKLAPMVQEMIRSLQDSLWSQSTFQAKEIFVALRAIAQSYSGLPGRKNVVLISGGFIHSPDAQPQMDAVIETANRANVAFYVIDTTGLRAGFGAESGGMEFNPTQELYMASQLGTDGEFDWAARIAAESLQNDLGELALATGGFGVTNQNDLYHALSLVDADLREFYTLVYQPHITSYDGSFHRIRVELKRSGYHLRYREGYWAIPPGEEAVMTPAAAQLINNVRSGALKPRLTASVAAAELIAPDGKPAMPLRVSFPGSSIKFTRNKNLYESNITLVLLAPEGASPPLSVYQRFINLSLNKSQWVEFTKKPVDINARLAIPALAPLRVQAIAQFEDGGVAYGERDLEISAPSAGGLQLSSLLLSDRIVPAQGPANASDPLRGRNFELFLPQRTDFAPSGQLTLYFGVSGIKPGTQALDVEVLLRSGSQPVRSLGRETIDPSTSHGAALVLRQFALNGLAPGPVFSASQRVERAAGDDVCEHRFPHILSWLVYSKQSVLSNAA